MAQLSKERFQLFALLVERSPEFVPDEEIHRTIVCSASTAPKNNAVRVLVYRLRQDLGLLGRRIKNTRSKGWIYLQPKPPVAIISEAVPESVKV